MQTLPVPHKNNESAERLHAETLVAQKRHIRALKRVLIAKAEVRRLKSLMGRHRVTSR